MDLSEHYRDLYNKLDEIRKQKSAKHIKLDCRVSVLLGSSFPSSYSVEFHFENGSMFGWSAPSAQKLLDLSRNHIPTSEDEITNLPNPIE